eukprot:s4666_g3.t1
MRSYAVALASLACHEELIGSRHEAAEALAALRPDDSEAMLCDLRAVASSTSSIALQHTYEQDPADGLAGATEAEVPWAAERLADSSRPLYERYEGMFTLRNVGGPAATQALAKMLVNDSSSAVLRHEVAFVLGQMADDAATQALAQTEEHGMVRHEAAIALGNIGTRGGLEGLLGALGGAAGGAGGLEAIWENPMVTSIAFHPSKAEPQFLDSTGAVRDGTFEMSDGTKISYRFYVPPDAAGVKAVIYFFHGNAEVCTALDDVAEMLHSCGAAVLSVDYRGYAWGTGQPSLKKLCPDAEQCFLQSEALLQAAGVGEAKRVMLGRSIGATCAVHLAAKQARRVHGLIVDSGLMSIKQIPTVSMLAPMVFQGQTEKFAMLPEPFDTLGKLSSVGCPVLVMHGDKDEIVPYQQAVQCHEKLATGSKKLQCWIGAGHNDCWALYFEAWKQEVKTLLEQAASFEVAFPAGAMVETHSLSTETMNGIQGRVLGPQGDRFRVSLAEHGEKALKPGNLKIVDVEPEKGVLDFPVGATVEAHSLSAPTFNGLQGKVLGEQGDRIRIDFLEHGQYLDDPDALVAQSCEVALATIAYWRAWEDIAQGGGQLELRGLSEFCMFLIRP